MRGLIFLAGALLPLGSFADNLWLEAAASDGSANGTRIAASRTLGSFGLNGVSVGMKHNRVAESWWTLLDVGMNRRLSEKIIVSGDVQIGPGQLDDVNFSYRKIKVAGTWLVSPKWSAEFSDSYVNVDTTIGHVLATSLTRYQANYNVTLHLSTSAGSAIDNRQMGASFRWNRQYSVIGGVFAGETSNPVTLRQVGGLAGNDSVQLRQAYVGVTIPIGRYSLLGVVDVLRLGDAERRELSLVLTVPLGTNGAGR